VRHDNRNCICFASAHLVQIVSSQRSCHVSSHSFRARIQMVEAVSTAYTSPVPVATLHIAADTPSQLKKLCPSERHTGFLHPILPCLRKQGKPIPTEIASSRSTIQNTIVLLTSPVIQSRLSAASTLVGISQRIRHAVWAFETVSFQRRGATRKGPG
jgi:hypothetical protein